MAVIGGRLGHWLLRRISPPADYTGGCDVYENRSKIDTFFGPEFWPDVVGKVVIDFGCGSGSEAVEMTKRGACRVTGIDIRETVLEKCAALAKEAGISDRCTFTQKTGRNIKNIKGSGVFTWDGPAGLTLRLAPVSVRAPRRPPRRWRALCHGRIRCRGPCWGLESWPASPRHTR